MTLKAYVQYNKRGRLVRGGPILSHFKPKTGDWVEIPIYKSASSSFTTGNRSTLKAYVRYSGSNRVIPGSIIITRNIPRRGNWADIELYKSNTITTTTTSYQLEAETSSLISRFNTLPSFERQVLINESIKSMKDGGLFLKLDSLCLVGEEQQGSLQNWIQNSFNGTLVNSPDFVANRYFQGNGIDSAINTNLKPNTDICKYNLNSATFGVVYISAATSYNKDGALRSVFGTPPTTHGSIITNNGYVLINQQSYQANGVSVDITVPKVITGVRSSSSILSVYSNEALVETVSNNSTYVPSSNLYVLGTSGSFANYSDAKIAGWFIGEALNINDIQLLTYIINNYLQSIEAI